MRGFWHGFEKRARGGFLKLSNDAFAKRSYGEKDIKNLDPHDHSEVWTAKIDGAHTVIKLTKGETPALYSHRVSKRTGTNIAYNEKLPHIKTPSPADGLLRGETYAVYSNGSSVHPDVVTALLNSGPAKSLELQKRLGIKTKTALIDVDHWNGQDMANAPFEAKREIMRQLVKHSPDFNLPATAETPKEKMRLLSQITSGAHPETKEGIVVHKKSEASKFYKAKMSNDHDVYVREIFHESPTKEGRPQGMAGGFSYSWEPSGPIVGKVGTGFDHKMKKEMADDPSKFIGRVALIRALDVSKNKVLMKPSFQGWHVDKNLD
jgi:hypothetical protein